MARPFEICLSEFVDFPHVSIKQEARRERILVVFVLEGIEIQGCSLYFFHGTYCAWLSSPAPFKKWAIFAFKLHLGEADHSVVLISAIARWLDTNHYSIDATLVGNLNKVFQSWRFC